MQQKRIALAASAAITGIAATAVSLLESLRPGVVGTLRMMPTVETSVLVNAPLEVTYAVAKDNESFPEYMKDVKSLTIIEKSDTRVVSDWVGVIPTFGLKVRWRQEDLWDDARHHCDFKMLEGDYDSLDGTWSFREENGGTRFDSAVNYEYNVPTLGPLVKKVIFNIVTRNMQDTLNAIKDRAEAMTSQAQELEAKA